MSDSNSSNQEHIVKHYSFVDPKPTPPQPEPSQTHSYEAVPDKPKPPSDK